MEDKTKYGNSYLNSKAEIIINEIDVDDVFINQSILQLYQIYKKF